MLKKLSTTIKWQLKERPLVALALLLILAVVVWYFGGAFVSGVRSALSAGVVSQTQGQAQEQVKQADASNEAADGFGVERKVEDAIRARTIDPEVERAGRVVVERHERTRSAEAVYEQARKASAVGGGVLNDSGLRARNCADLRKLYPGDRFEYCR